MKQIQEAWFKPEIGEKARLRATSPRFLTLLESRLTRSLVAGRSPLNARNVENLPIHEHLSGLDKKSQEVKKVKAEGREAQEKEIRTFKANKKSQKMLESMKRQSCEELFRVLLATIDFKRQGGDRKGDVNESIAELVADMQDEVGGEGVEAGRGDWRVKLLDATLCDPDLLDDNVSKIVKPLLARHQGSPMSLNLFVDLAIIELDRVGIEALDVVRTMRNRQREQVRPKF